jgi:hypothetical protein
MIMVMGQYKCYQKIKVWVSFGEAEGREES